MLYPVATTYMLEWSAQKQNIHISLPEACMVNGRDLYFGYNEKEHLWERRLSSNTLCLTIYSKWRGTLSIIVLFTSQLCTMQS